MLDKRKCFPREQDQGQEGLLLDKDLLERVSTSWDPSFDQDSTWSPKLAKNPLLLNQPPLSHLDPSPSPPPQLDPNVFPSCPPRPPPPQPAPQLPPPSTSSQPPTLVDRRPKEARSTPPPPAPVLPLHFSLSLLRTRGQLGVLIRRRREGTAWTSRIIDSLELERSRSPGRRILDRSWRIWLPRVGAA